MKKNILVFSNGEKIGDGIIKLPFLHEIKKRLPDYNLIWLTNLGSTVYNKELKNIADQYIDEIIENVNLNPFFWKKISNKYDFSKRNFTCILDTQKAVYRTIALKRIKSKHFISSCSNGLFSTIKLNNKNKLRKYYLDNLYDLLDLIKYEKKDDKFKVNIPVMLNSELNKIFLKEEKYFGLAPGAGEKNKIWPLEKFIEVGKIYEKKNFKIVLFLGPQEKNIKKILKNEFPNSIMPEEIIKNYSNIEVVMASTKYLSFAVANDSGVSHMLSTKHCPLIKLFGPKESQKFTPSHRLLKTISSSEYNSKDINVIKVEKVILEIDKYLHF